ncbi:hypothetical protein C8J57DRAFT_1460341 [Mycena rebaudengoi]|nr:hypothetical protein C8J57DRAFT_1460341 [Mycena rebaudengoi]
MCGGDENIDSVNVCGLWELVLYDEMCEGPAVRSPALTLRKRIEKKDKDDIARKMNDAGISEAWLILSRRMDGWTMRFSSASTTACMRSPHTRRLMSKLAKFGIERRMNATESLLVSVRGTSTFNSRKWNARRGDAVRRAFQALYGGLFEGVNTIRRDRKSERSALGRGDEASSSRVNLPTTVKTILRQYVNHPISYGTHPCLQALSLSLSLGAFGWCFASGIMKPSLSPPSSAFVETTYAPRWSYETTRSDQQFQLRPDPAGFLLSNLIRSSVAGSISIKYSTRSIVLRGTSRGELDS